MSFPEWISPDGKIRLICADCLEVLPTLKSDSVDTICTDPPYNVTEQNGRDGTTPGRVYRADGSCREVVKNFGEWDRNYDPQNLLLQAERILRVRGNLLAFCSDRLLSSYVLGPLKHMRTVLWKKTNPPGSFNANYPSCIEWIAWSSKAAPGVFNGSRTESPIFEFPLVHHKHRVHPTQKPVLLMERLIALHTNTGELICDPYAGSCTTAVACIRSNRRCIGIEKDRKYFVIGVERCKAEYSRTALLNGVPA